MFVNFVTMETIKRRCVQCPDAPKPAGPYRYFFIFHLFSVIRRYNWECMDGMDDDLRFYVPFNSVSVKSGRWTNNDERLYAI